MKAPCAVMLLLVACVDTQGGDPGESDGSRTAALDELSSSARPVTIAIHADVEPALLVYRRGVSGAWRAARKLTATTYEARVTGAFSVLAVCADPLAPYTQVISRIPADGPTVDVFCAFPEQPAGVEVSVSMAQPGTITLGDQRRTSTQPGWTWQLNIPPGTYDLVAASADRVTVRRGHAIASDSTLPAIDLATEGTQLADQPLVVTNPVPGEDPFALVYLMTPGTQPQALIYRGPVSTTKVAPDSVIGAGEDQEVSVRSQSVDPSRSILRTTRRTVRAGGDATFALRELLEGARFAVNSAGDLTLRWRRRTPLEYLTASVFDQAGHSMSIDASGPYLEATRVRQVSFATEVPGFLPEWKVDLTQASSYDASASTYDGGRVPGERWGYFLTEFVNQQAGQQVAPQAALRALEAPTRELPTARLRSRAGF